MNSFLSRIKKVEIEPNRKEHDSHICNSCSAWYVMITLKWTYIIAMRLSSLKELCLCHAYVKALAYMLMLTFWKQVRNLTRTLILKWNQILKDNIKIGKMKKSNFQGKKWIW